MIPHDLKVGIQPRPCMAAVELTVIAGAVLASVKTGTHIQRSIPIGIETVRKLYKGLRQHKRLPQLS